MKILIETDLLMKALGDTNLVKPAGGVKFVRALGSFWARIGGKFFLRPFVAPTHRKPTAASQHIFC